MIFKAVELATKAHSGQYRKGTKIPCITHPLDVARTLIQIENKDNEITLNLSIDDDCPGKVIFNKYQEPLSLITRVGRNGFNYTHKEAGIPIDNQISPVMPTSHQTKPDLHHQRS